MGTYFRYAERNVEKAVNWQEIGKSISDSLIEENRLREEKKAAIDEQTRKDMGVLRDVPQGESPSLNAWGLEFGANATEMRLIQERLLKKGILKPKDYTIQRQNLMDGTNEAFSLVKDASAIYAEGLKRANEGTSAAQEQWQRAQLEIFGDFSKSGLYINPNDYTVSVAMRDPITGRLDENPDSHRSLSSLRGMMSQKIDKYDVEGHLKAVVDKLGTWVNASRPVDRNGNPLTGLKSVEDAMLQPDFVKMENTIIDSMMTNPINVGSVLTDYIKADPTNKKVYTFTTDPKLKGTSPEIIYMVQDPASKQWKPELTPAQESLVKEKLKERLHTMILHKEEAETKFAPQYKPQTPPPPKETFNAVGRLYYGNSGEIQSAVNYIKGFDPENIQDVTRDEKKVTIKYKNGETAELPFYAEDGTLLTQKEFIEQSRIITGIDDIFSAVPKGMYDPSKTFNPTGKGSTHGTPAPKVTTPATPLKSYTNSFVITGTNEKGDPIKQTIPQYVDENLQKWSRFANGMSVAESYSEVANTVLSRLPQELTANMDVNAFDYDETGIGNASVTEIYMPNVMSAPLFIPANMDTSAKKKVLQKLYDRSVSIVTDLQSGKTDVSKINPEELKGDFTEGYFYPYNRDIMYQYVGFKEGETNVAAGGGFDWSEH